MSTKKDAVDACTRMMGEALHDIVMYGCHCDNNGSVEAAEVAAWFEKNLTGMLSGSEEYWKGKI